MSEQVTTEESIEQMTERFVEQKYQKFVERRTQLSEIGNSLVTIFDTNLIPCKKTKEGYYIVYEYPIEYNYSNPHNIICLDSGGVFYKHSMWTRKTKDSDAGAPEIAGFIFSGIILVYFSIIQKNILPTLLWIVLIGPILFWNTRRSLKKNTYRFYKDIPDEDLEVVVYEVQKKLICLKNIIKNELRNPT